MQNMYATYFIFYFSKKCISYIIEITEVKIKHNHNKSHKNFMDFAEIEERHKVLFIVRQQFIIL